MSVFRSAVAAVPSPPDTGTTLKVTAADERFFPDPAVIGSYEIVAWAPLTEPIPGNYNLITNPSFEVDLSGWSVSSLGSPVLTRDQSQAGAVAAGLWAGKLVCGATAASMSLLRNGAAALTDDTKDRVYCFSIFTYVPTGSSLIGKTVVAMVRVNKGAGIAEEGFSSSTVLVAGSNRISVSHRIVASDLTNIDVEVQVTSPANGETLWVDAAMLERGPAPSQYTDPVNAEIMTVTAKSVSSPNLLTVLRAQQGSSARTILVGDYVSLVPDQRMFSQALGGYDVGDVKWIPHDAIPANWGLCNGAAISRTEYSILFGKLGTLWGAGDGSTTFNLPDIGGREIVGKGTNPVVDTVGKTEGVALGNRRGPKHRHTPHTHTYNAAATAAADWPWDPTFQPGVVYPPRTLDPADGGSGVASDPLDGGAFAVGNFIIRLY